MSLLCSPAPIKVDIISLFNHFIIKCYTIDTSETVDVRYPVATLISQIVRRGRLMSVPR